MRLSLLALPFAAVLIGASHYKDIPHKIKEKTEGPPRGWLRNDPAPSSHMLELKIALPQPHFPILEKHLWEVSNPKHKRYGAYLSKEETEALMAPDPETLDVVRKWLSSHGIEEEHLYHSSAQDWITIRIPVAVAEKMLNTVRIWFYLCPNIRKRRKPEISHLYSLGQRREHDQNNQLQSSRGLAQTY
ncbi:hypothetical protein J3R83DRAFT_1257 [Lanmaoa asiatica]|nr:hypothetical protein J3R83DRAFT_1257 [Lanmaoa asiatica]